MPAEPVAQPCEVCGVETTQRCSACVEAGIDLFFCSKDHQKLVWPAHKAVCGPTKARPFAVLPLAPYELAWATSRLDVPYSERGATLRRDLESMSKTGEPAEALLRRLSHSGTDLLGYNFMFLIWTRAWIARQLKKEPLALAHVARAPAYEKAHFNPHLAAGYCSQIVLLVSIVIADSVELECSATAWFSLIQHKALLVNRLAQLASADEQPQVCEWAVQMTTRLYDWIKAGAGCDDAKIRRRLASFRAPGGL